MLVRKQSRQDNQPLADYGADEFSDAADVAWIYNKYIRWGLRICALFSFVSVCLNTPETFRLLAPLRYITFLVDLLISVFFTAEMVTKIHSRGLMKGEGPYMKSKWNIFDAIMTIFHWVSVILHLFQMCGVVSDRTALSVLRTPRTLILVRGLRVYLKFQLPKARINNIFRRSGQQIWNVTIFLLFYVSLYALLGVQLFGDLKRHCVTEDTEDGEVTLNSLAIPDTYCSMIGNGGYQCPSGMKCMELNLKWNQQEFNGFKEFARSVFTVYESASQEGWIYAMYRTMDSLHPWRSYVYFFTMIFFLAWLVKNVFIAVVIETFAEIRVQFQQIWGNRGLSAADNASQVLLDDGYGWKLVTMDLNKPRGLAPYFFQKVLQTTTFHLTMLVLVLVDASLAASIFYNPLRLDSVNQYTNALYIAQVVFTIIFDLEAMFKIWCLGYHGYIKRILHKYELFLAIGNTLRLIPSLHYTELTYFQVLRIFRLIKMSPVTEDFVYKIFGPGKKLGTLVIFTMSTLILTSGISLQFFCSISNQFRTFPEAFMYMFQILTQEGWVEVMDAVMALTQSSVAPFVAIYFIGFHLFATLIVMSLFVAVILDNLELDEDVKRIKQLKAREQRADTTEKLPMRLRIFEKFPDTPKISDVNKLSSEFVIPKIRDSFMRHFITSDEDVQILLNPNACRKAQKTEKRETIYRRPTPLKVVRLVDCEQPSGLSIPEKKIAVNYIIKDASKQRILCDSGQVNMGPYTSLFSTHHQVRQDIRALRQGSMKQDRLAKTLDHIKENGDLGMSSTRKTRRDLDIKILQEKRQQAEIKRTAQEVDLRENHPMFDTPMFIFGRNNRVRKLCRLIVYASFDPTSRDFKTGIITKSKYQQLKDILALVPYLDWVMLIITTVSCISMMFETPHQRVMDSPLLQVAEFAFIVGASIELLLKVIADGLFFTPKALIHDMAGFLCLCSYLSSLIFVCWMPLSIPSHSWAQILLLIRCLRPLRIFILVPDMRKVVYELFKGFKEIILVSILLLVLIFIFASFGVQMFAGKLQKCNDSTIKTREECVGVFERKVFVAKFIRLEVGEGEEYPAMLVPRVWANPATFNFDTLGNAMLVLFEMLTLEGWVEVRDALIVHPIDAIYVHVFVFIGCLIGVTLFVGVVIANFNENKGTALLTVDQRRWEDLKSRLKIVQPLHIPPRPDGMGFRARLYDITQHRYFKRGIASLVIANSSLLVVQWWEHAEHSAPLATCCVVFTVIFAIEVVMKMICFSPAGYWQSRRNRYDLFVTIVGGIWAVLHFTMRNAISYSLGAGVIMLRFFTICGKQTALKMLLLTVIVSMYKSFFIILSLFLLILSYAFAGVVLFGTVKYGENLHRRANFESAGSAMSVLFRIVTGEDWNKIMHDCMLSPPYCTVGDNYWDSDCGNSSASLGYFCSFYVLLAFIMLNLLVAIIVENFSLFYSNEEDALLSYADIKHFQHVWNLIDINRRGCVPVRRVKFVLRLLKGRLEVDLEKDKLLFKHMCCEIEKLHNGQDVTFHDVLSMLSYRSVDIRKVLQFDELLEREELEYNIEEEVAKQTIRNWIDKCVKRMKSKEKPSLLSTLRANQLEDANRLLPTVMEQSATPIKLRKDDSRQDDVKKTASSPDDKKKHLLAAPSTPDAGSKEKMTRRLGARAILASKMLDEAEQTANSSPRVTVTKPQKSSSLGVHAVTSEVKDWWKEQLRYESDDSDMDDV